MKGMTMNNLWLDLRYGVRTLFKSRGFTLVAVLALALGIGANTTIFSVVNAVLLRPLKYPNPEQLVLVRDTQPPSNETPADYAEYLDWRDQAQVFEHLAAYFNTTYTLTGRGDPQQLWGVRISTNTLPALGVNPILGRGFLSEEEARSSERVALISYGLWQRQFAGDLKVVGQSITLDAKPHTIVGVLPNNFRALNPADIQRAQERDVWVPLRLNSEVAPRGLNFLTVFGRLRPGVSLAQANAAMTDLSARLQKERSIDHGIKLMSLQQASVPAGMRTMLLLLLGAVGFVLLIACGNVANLLLARSSARQKEMAIRLAVGASRSRVIRQLLTESLLLALLSGGLGLLLSFWGVGVFVTTARTLLPRLDEVGLDLRVLLFTLGVSLVTGLIFGIAPALRASKGELHETLKEGGRTSVGVGQQRLRGLLVVVQVALSLVLLIGAGLLVKSFVHVLTADKGFDAEQVLTANLSLSSVKYPEPPQQARFFQQFLERLKTVPGVEGAAIINHAPLVGGGVDGGIKIEGRTDPPNQLPIAEKSIISPEFFSVMRTSLVRGRVFTERDNAGTTPVAIINESLARRYFEGQDAIGKRIDFNWDTKGTQEIVGIVRDMKQYGLDLPTAPTIYVPYLQRPDAGMTVVVRSFLEPASLVGAMRQQLLTLDKEQPLAQVKTMQQAVADSTAQRRVMVVVSALFGALALLLAALGLYGVIAYTVTLRTREIGVRMALGAQRRDVLRLVLRKGMALALIGIAVGLAGALALTRLMVSLLFQVTATDATTFTAVPALLLIVALLACFIPARRATKVDPLVALRYE
jgi:putative ABC transport system permease protein